ncbi:hypothetical protein LINPERHAP2_LOCUS60 [Linum perenne]
MPASKKQKGKTCSTWAPIWQEYHIVYVKDSKLGKEIRKGKCKRCGTEIVSDGRKYGTTALTNHVNSCKRKLAESDGQTILNYNKGEVWDEKKKCLWKFNQDEARVTLVEMIILDEHAFRIVEKQGFKRFMEICCQMFRVPSRKTVRGDCIKLFLQRRDSMKCFFQAKGI